MEGLSKLCYICSIQKTGLKFGIEVKGACNRSQQQYLPSLLLHSFLQTIVMINTKNAPWLEHVRMDATCIPKMAFNGKPGGR
jgi:hypothetical protein